MHHRGKLDTPYGRTVTRGSVWIEQEIAIVAFIRQVMNWDIPVL